MGNSIFDLKLDNYLNECENENNIKGAIIVTDKQCVMATELETEKDSHNDLISHIENLIHPNDSADGWLSYKLHDAYLLAEGPELMINLPLDGNLSINQANFMIDIIARICKFNAENGDIISIEIVSSNDWKAYRTHTVDKVGKYILSLSNCNYIDQDEKIIGKTIINNEIDKPKVYEKH